MLYLKISLNSFFNHYNSNTQKPKRADSLGQGNFHLNPWGSTLPKFSTDVSNKLKHTAPETGGFC